jgi:hypothetical protein
LLGVGSDVGATNEPSGAQLELFDVANPSAPRLLQKTTLGESSSSQVQYDHHAFLYWPGTKLAVLPVEIYPTYPGSVPPSNAGFAGAIGFRIDQSGIVQVGRISHPARGDYTSPITRSMVVGDKLYTLSDEGLLASSLDTLAATSFVPFPNAPQISAASPVAP